MTASDSKHTVESVTVPSDAMQSTAHSTSANTADFVPHTHTDTPHADAEASPAAKPASTRPLSALFMGVLGGIITALTLGAIALIFNPLSDLTDRVSAIETTVAGTATRRSVETNDKRLAALEGRLDNLRTDIDTLNRNPITGPVDLNGLKNHLAQIDQSLSQLQQDTSKNKSSASLPLAQDAARLTLAFVIVDKIEQGQAIGNELQTIAALMDEHSLASLADLKPWTEGNPTQGALMQELSRAYPASLKAAPVPDHESIADYSLRHLKQWVHWRRMDQKETTDPESLLHLITLDVQKASYETAVQHMRSLPEPMQGPLQGFSRMLSQRIEANKAGERLFQNAMTQLARNAENKGGSQ